MLFNKLKTFILLFALSILLLLLGNFFGGVYGLQIALVIALLFNLIAYFFSDKIVLSMYGAQPLDSEQYSWIYNSVQNLANEMNIPMPKLWLINSQMANAFATGRNPHNASVAITSGIITILEEHELRGVLAHELSHVKNRDILIATIAATIATTISYMASMLRFTAFLGSSGGSGDRRRNGNIFTTLLVAILMPIAAVLIQLAISRSREYLADETGAYYSKDPLALASALEKLQHASEATSQHINPAGKESTASLFIVNPFSGKNVLALFSTHPPVSKRINRLQEIYQKTL